jgi:dTDP-4-amino-4,6-dideoxygalactose transaminase
MPSSDPGPESGVFEVIPVANPAAKFKAREHELIDAMRRVIASGRYILGRETEAFEHEVAEFTGVDYCIGVGTGTDALTLALMGLGVAHGDEVLTVSHTAVATVAAIERAGAVPVFVDVEPQRRTMDPVALEAAIGPRCRALVVVHLYGQPADMTAIVKVAKQHGLAIVEDCAQAHGATLGGLHVGGLGDIGTFSFYPTKNLGAVGDGGAVVTNDREVAERVRRLRQYGWDDERRATMPGMCSRLDELHAAMLRVMLVTLWDDVRKRQAIARRYDATLAGTRIVTPSRVRDTEHAYHLYVVEHDRRDDLADELRSLGVATGIHYPRPVHREPAYENRIRGCDRLPQTERLANIVLSLPMYPEMTEEQIEHVCRALEECAGGLR